MVEAAVAASTPPARRVATARGSWRRRALVLLVLLVAGCVLAEIGRVLLGSNFHTVIPGRVYRSAQPSPRALDRAVAEHGVRTIINLRGCCNPLNWYLEESRATHRLDLGQEDLCFSAGRLPSTSEMRRLVEVLDHCDYPVLLHCRRGADRTGLAATIVLLLQTDAPFAEAARQLGARYGHVAFGRPASLDWFLDLYVDWLKQKGYEHSGEVFRHWLLQEYRPGPCSARIELLSERPPRATRGEPFPLRIRAHNTGIQTWHFHPMSHVGIHCGFHVWNERDLLVASGKVGLLETTVAPGQSIELTLLIPAIREPGRYRLRVDLVDEDHCWFFQTGSEPLEEEIIVP